MRRKIIAGNWKMHGTRASVDHLLKSVRARSGELGDAELVVFPPSLHIHAAAELLSESQVAWGAQDVSFQAQGAYTGDVSACMLRDYGCGYVIVGHSERRQYHQESNDDVAEKAFAVLEANMTPVVCIGESAEQRDAGDTFDVLAQQLTAVLTRLAGHASLRHVVIAYEPIWAIGTGRQASGEQIQAVHAHIRAQSDAHEANLGREQTLLYGGSVNPGNAADILSLSDVDGVLVGGASLDADKFIEIGLCIN